MPRTLVIGTRGSKLALRQVDIVSSALRRAHPDIALDVRMITTHGDASGLPLSVIGGTGVFTKAIEDRLLAGEIDIAVHSLKDLPPESAAGLTIGAVPPREDMRDALITREGVPLAELPRGARIGTGSGRRAVQVRALNPAVSTDEIRGNVDTRIRKVLAGEYDGAVLALAGLLRLGLEEQAAQVFSVGEMLPAVGQGALAVHVRAEDAEAVALISAIDDPASHAATDAERAFLARLGAGCRMPAGAYAVVSGDRLRIDGMLAADDRNGSIYRTQYEGAASAPHAAGVALAEKLFAGGAPRFDGAAP